MKKSTPRIHARRLTPLPQKFCFHHCPAQQLCSQNVVVTLNISSLEMEDLQAMVEALPTAHELEAMKWQENVQGHGTVEHFILAVSEVPRFSSKFNVFVVSKEFPGQFAALHDSINDLASGCIEVISSARLKSILQSILSVVNAMNRAKGKAELKGIQIRNLNHVSTIKDKDNQSVIEQVVSGLLDQGDPQNSLCFMSAMQSIEKAKRIDLKDLQLTLQGLKESLNEVRNALLDEERSAEGEASAVFIRKSRPSLGTKS